MTLHQHLLIADEGNQRLVLASTQGELLWEYPWRTSYDVNASQPLLIGDNRVFVSTGYGTGAAVIELTPGAGGGGGAALQGGGAAL